VNVEPEIVVAAAAVFAVGSFVQASVGFGAHLLATPVLALLDPDLVPGPIFVAGTALVISTAARERSDIDWTAVGWGTVGRIPGAALGAVVLARVSDSALQLTVAIAILLAVVLSAGWLRVPANRPAIATAGSVSGFGATTAGIGGPPMALVLQTRPGPEFRSSMGAFFGLGTFITLPAIAAAGRLGQEEVVVGLAMLPGAALGFLASGPVRRFVDQGRLRPLILGLATLAALALIVRVAL
jgi:uncharacterized membrane protein YfcA